VIITVKDKGVGVVKDKLDAIFDITNESMRGTRNKKVPTWACCFAGIY